MRNHITLFIEVIYQRTSCWNIESSNILFTNMILVHNESTKRITMSRDDKTFAFHHSREDFLLPIRKETISSRLERFSQRKLFLRNISIATIISRIILGFRSYRWRRNIVATSPDHHLHKIRTEIHASNTTKHSNMYHTNYYESKETLIASVKFVFTDGNHHQTNMQIKSSAIKNSQLPTCSIPCSLTVSCLLSPVRAP